MPTEVETILTAARAIVPPDSAPKLALARWMFRASPTPPEPLRGDLWHLHDALTKDTAALDAALGDAPPTGAALGALHQQLMAAGAEPRQGRRKRRSAGVFYTPAATALWLAEQTFDGLDAPGGLRIADPCCGCGAFLLAAIDALHRAGRLEQLASIQGTDLDAVAVDVARWAVWQRLDALGANPDPAALLDDIRVSDGLTAEMGPLDAVLSNPPFGNAIESDTVRSGDEQARNRALLPEIARGAYDKSVLFAARAVERLRPGGRYGLVLPRGVLSVASAMPLRAFMAREAPPDMLWSPQSARLFKGADVFVAMIKGQRGAPSGDLRVSAACADLDGGPEDGLRHDPGPLEATWAPALLPENRLVRQIVGSGVPLTPLGDILGLHGGAATGAAYDLKPCVTDDAKGPGPRLITTGLIDRHTDLWGIRPCRYLGMTLTHPRWPGPDDPQPPSVRRARERQIGPKVIVAGLSKIIEALADPKGHMAGVVSTWVLRPPEDGSLWLVEALLNAPALSLIYMTRFRGKEMSGGNTTIGRRELASLPIPTDLFSAAPSNASIPRPDAWPAAFSLDPMDPSNRRQLAHWAASAVERPPGARLDPRRDALASACISALYGLDLSAHTAILAWFDARCGTDLSIS